MFDLGGSHHQKWWEGHYPIGLPSDYHPDGSRRKKFVHLSPAEQAEITARRKDLTPAEQACLAARSAPELHLAGTLPQTKADTPAGSDGSDGKDDRCERCNGPLARKSRQPWEPRGTVRTACPHCEASAVARKAASRQPWEPRRDLL